MIIYEKKYLNIVLSEKLKWLIKYLLNFLDN